MVLVASNIAVSQTENDSIKVVMTINDISAKYFYKGQQLSFDSLYQIMKVNDEASKMMKQAKGSRVFAKTALITGVAIITISLLDRMQKNNNNSAWLAVGGGISALSIIGIVESNKYKRRAVKLYNSNLSAQLPKTNKVIFGFGQTPSGVGFSLRF